MLIPKWIARKPIANTRQYLKFGFVITECESHYCPRCGGILNAGPNYQPIYCDRCGQKLDFYGIEWKEEKEIGFAERGNADEPLKNRMV